MVPATSQSEQLSTNFRREEFACRCGCGLDDVALGLVDGLQALREKAGVPITILSGCRCLKHNKAVGGAPSSYHLMGHAADIRAKGMSAKELYEVARHIPQFGGFGLDMQRNMLHVDVRDVRAWWTYKDGKAVQVA